MPLHHRKSARKEQSMQKTQPVDLVSLARQTMIKYGFEPDFSADVFRETEISAHRDHTDAISSVQDLRSLLWSSIDNSDSLDLDQIEYCEEKTGGVVLVKVAIADVDAFVQKDTAIDRHAAHNGTSVYTGVETFPMLPDSLSKGVSSLLPGSSHLTVVIEYSVHPDGSFIPGSLYQALVSNKAKLVYEEIGDWLEGKSGVPESVSAVSGLKQQLLLQNSVAQRLKEHRRRQGALDLGTLEATTVAEKGLVLDLIIQEQNMARCLIEEFMVAANGTTVHFLNHAKMPMIQRIVRTPKNWEGIRMTAAQFREKLPRTPDVKALARFLKHRRDADPERFPDLSLTIVKLMGPGEYVPFIPGEPPIGHFALAVTDYTHGTAPNRRYVDLIIQRIIKSVLSGKSTPYSATDLTRLASWLTSREKGSKKVERFMEKAAAAVLLQRRIGDLFNGLITGASEKGTYVRIMNPPVEGRVIKGCKGLYVGQKVRVRLIHADPQTAFIDFDCTGKTRE